MRDHPLRKITVVPGLPSDLIRNTLEGAMLWGILRLQPDEDEASKSIIGVSHNAVEGAGTIAYSLGGGTADFWIDLARESRGDFAKAAFSFFNKGTDYHRGIFDLNRCIDERGTNPLSLTKILQSILVNHADKIPNDHFVVRIAPSEFDEDVSFGAAFVTSSDIEHLNLERWIEKKSREHKAKSRPKPGLIF